MNKAEGQHGIIVFYPGDTGGGLVHPAAATVLSRNCDR